jgi:hypothetical protein
VVEIGAGEPLVAATLARMGYEVTVVDPYDGSGNGPIEYRSFVRAYPSLKFVRDTFPPTEPLATSASGPVGCVYSISVLEHVPVAAVRGVVEAARELVREGGLCVHAVDHVLRGWSADKHRELTGEVAAASGISADHLDEILGLMDADPETYLVSAEAHNLWRGELAYDEYPMRRVGSVQIFDRVGS